MIINIKQHYFGYYSNTGDLKELNGFHVGEIVTDWNGQTGCILMIFKNGDVRTDSNGIGDISKLKKLKSKFKILSYLNHLHNADNDFMKMNQEKELKELQN